MKRVAVVGAGWAGLAAATALAERGIPVRLLEASRQLGGRARRVELEGVAVDNGQHILIGAYRQTLRLVRLVGVDPDRVLARLPLELRLAGGFRLRAPPLPAPWHLAAALAGARGLAAGEKLAALRFIASLRRSGYRLAGDCTVGTLLARARQPERIRRRLWEPLCIAALNTPAAEASAQVFANVLRDTFESDRAASDLLLPRADLGTVFPDAAAAFVRQRGGEIALGAAVRSLAPAAGGGWSVGEAGRFAAVVLATPSWEAAELLRGVAGLGPLAADLAAFRFQPIYTCYLQFAADVRLPFPMIGFEDGPIHWAFDRGALTGDAGLIAAVTSARGAHEDAGLEAFARAAREAVAAVAASLPELRWSRVIAERRATFACTPGLRRPANPTALPGLALAGDYTESDYPGTLEAAVRSGLAAAAIVARAVAA
ncbi:MAG: hydroxysqualene dehydroxylase HpnE [Burkholderiales bacterium]|nr:hydroxysqualene dehydroxylase HpnE [Burkholderiales bacterium]